MLDKTSAGNRAPQHRQTRRILQTFAGTFGPICPWSSWSCRLERQWWGAMQSWAADMLIADVFYDSMRSMEWQCHAEPCRCRVDIRQARPACVPCADRSCSSEKNCRVVGAAEVQHWSTISNLNSRTLSHSEFKNKLHDWDWNLQ